MSAKTNRNQQAKTPVSQSTKSQTPSKLPKSHNPGPKSMKSSLSTYRRQSSHEYSAEPLRMSIKLEEILKTCKKSFNKITLKAELIEPEIESSIPCIEYIPRTRKQSLPNAKINTTDFSKSIKTSHALNNFSLEKMDADCKQIEDDIKSQNNKRVLEDIENSIGAKFNCKVKLIPEKTLENVPSVVFVKNGNTFEAFHVSKC
jgi:hypothetical protein